MKKFYLLNVLLLSFLFFSCSKDFLKRYDQRIVGTWQITDVDRHGFGGNLDDLPFRDGTFVFNDDGSLTYTSSSNQNFQGYWNIQKKTIGEETLQSLEITAIDFV